MEAVFQKLLDQFDEAHAMYGHADMIARLYVRTEGQVDGLGFGAVFGWAEARLDDFSAKLPDDSKQRYAPVIIKARDEAAIRCFFELAHEAGAKLPANERQAIGIDADLEPKLAWLRFLLARLSAPLVNRETWSDRTAGETVAYTIRQPLRASSKAIAAELIVREEAGESSGLTETTQKARTREKVLLAADLVSKHPDWSMRRVASEVGLAHSTLSKSELFQQAFRMAQRDAGSLRRGFFDSNTGAMDAED